MKATIDIPDELYRRVKARSAMEGRPVRDVALGLFRAWMLQPAGGGATAIAKTSGNAMPAWFGIAGGARKVRSHAMGDVRRSIARGRKRDEGGDRT